MTATDATSEQLRPIVDSATDFAILSTNVERRVTTWNVGAERVLGWSAEEMKGRSADILFRPEDRAAGAPLHERRTALREGRAEDERWHLRRDGSRFWASGLLMPLRDGGSRSWASSRLCATARPSARPRRRWARPRVACASRSRRAA